MIRLAGMKNGEMRRGPRSCSVDRALGDAGQPADAGADHHAGALARLLVLRASSRNPRPPASAAAMRIDDELVHLALVLGRDPVVGVEEARRRSRRAAPAPAILAGRSETSKRLDRADARLAGDQPLPVVLGADAERRDQADAGDDDASHVALPRSPLGQSASACRRPVGSRPQLVRFDEAHRILHGHDLLGRVVRDLAPELLLEGHHQLDGVEAVGAQIVDEAGVFGHLRLVDAEMLDDDLLYPIGDVAHPLISSTG